MSERQMKVGARLPEIYQRLAEAVSAAAQPWATPFTARKNSAIDRAERILEDVAHRAHPRWQIEYLLIRLRGVEVSHITKCPWCCVPASGQTLWLKDDGTAFCFNCGKQPVLNEIGPMFRRRRDLVIDADPVIVALVWNLELPPGSLIDLKF